MNRQSIDRPGVVSFDEVRQVKLTVPRGRIDVIGMDGPPTLEVTKISGKPLNIWLSEGVLSLSHGRSGWGPAPLWWLRNQHIELSLGVPPDAAVELSVVSGSLVVSNFRRRVEVKGVSGDITLAGLTGGARVATVSGPITAEQVIGDLAIEAVSGSITVVASAGGRITAHTVSGDMAVDLVDPMPPEVDLQCVSGSLAIRLPHNPDVTVDLSSHGRVTSTLPGLVRSGPPSMRRLNGRVGAGTARLHGATMSGAVTVMARDADESAGSSQ
jgi:hypothetical protein